MTRSWISLEAKKINIPEKKQIGEVSFSVSLPPYDIPTEAGSYIDEQNGDAVFEFSYLNDNNEKLEPIDEDKICLMVGKKSRRVKELRVKQTYLKDLLASAGEHTIKAIHEVQLDRKGPTLGIAKNFSAARSALTNYKVDLVDSLDSTSA